MKDDDAPDEDPDEDLDEDFAPEAGVAGSDAPAAPIAGIVRTGCVVLIIVGVLLIVLAGGSILDPAGAQCSLNRRLIEDANEDDETFNDVDLQDRQVDDLECAEALELASRIPENEDGDLTTVPTKSAIRTQATVVGLVGLGQAVTAFMTLRTRDRRARTAALIFAAVVLLFPVLGIVSLVAVAFVVYALAFSAASKAIWPPRRAGLFRPRQRPTE